MPSAAPGDADVLRVDAPDGAALGRPQHSSDAAADHQPHQDVLELHLWVGAMLSYIA